MGVHVAPEYAIVLKINEYRYVFLNNVWHISSHVGATGRSQIFSFYNFVKEVNKLSNCHCMGRFLKKSDFDNILNGYKFPGSVLESTGPSFWWDDFTEVTSDKAQLSRYEDLYGKEFIYAQNVVKDFLEK